MRLDGLYCMTAYVHMQNASGARQVQTTRVEIAGL